MLVATWFKWRHGESSIRKVLVEATLGKYSGWSWAFYIALAVATDYPAQYRIKQVKKVMVSEL